MTWEVVVGAISAFIAGIGLLLTAWAIWENNKTRQLQLLSDSYKNINDNIRLLYTNYAKAKEEDKKNWDDLLFNSIELFAFFVNNEFIKNEKISSFFDDAIIHWYEGIFLEHCTKKQINDKKLYPEFKSLYKRIKTHKQPKPVIFVLNFRNPFSIMGLKIMIYVVAGAILTVIIEKLLANVNDWWFVFLALALAISTFLLWILSCIENGERNA